MNIAKLDKFQEKDMQMIKRSLQESLLDNDRYLRNVYIGKRETYGKWQYVWRPKSCEMNGQQFTYNSKVLKGQSSMPDTRPSAGGYNGFTMYPGPTPSHFLRKMS